MTAPAVSDATLGQGVGFAYLHRIWEAFRAAEAELATTLGVPLCVENCGLSCTTNTPSATRIEVKRACSYILSLSGDDRARILDRIEAWLLRPVLEVEEPLDPRLSVKRPRLGRAPGAPLPSSEVGAVTMGRCPMLDEQLRCSVYEARPLACRSYGVTRRAGPYCQRPTGLGETDSGRMVLRGAGKSDELKALVALWRETLGRDHPELLQRRIFGTAIFAELRPVRFREILPRIATAKLAGAPEGSAYLKPMLFDEEDEALLAQTIVHELMSKQRREEGIPA